MRIWSGLNVAIQLGVLGYFAVLNLLYALFGYIGLRSVMIHGRELSRLALEDLLDRDLEMPVSILVPAFNEQEGIVSSVHALLSLHYPEFQVVIVSDGSTDETIERMVEGFALVEVPQVYRRVIETQPITRIFRSLRHPNLVVAEKLRGGRADALNAGLNLARYPLYAAVDADCVLDAEAILRASRLFLEDETVVGVGGTIRPFNGSVLVEGHVAGLRLPKRWIERFQVLEYARAFYTGRAGWSQMGGLLIISGAFGLFRRDPVMRIGGYSTKTVCEDIELVVRIHKTFKRSRTPYRILFIPDPICWTEVPSSMRILRAQRNRWHRGLMETLWSHRDMVGNPRYGTVGLVAIPYFWAFEALSPIVEFGGYLFIVASALTGRLNVTFAVLFIVLAVLFGMLLSQVAVGIETLLLARYPRVRDRAILVLAAFLESFGYRQILTFERAKAMFQVQRKRGKWGEMTRSGMAQPTSIATRTAEARLEDPVAPAELPV